MISEEILQLLIFKNADMIETDQLWQLEEMSLKYHRWDIYAYFWVVQMTMGLLEINSFFFWPIEAEHQATFTRSVVWLSLRRNFYFEFSNVKSCICAGESKEATVPWGRICRKSNTFLIDSLVHICKSIPLIHVEYLGGGVSLAEVIITCLKASIRKKTLGESATSDHMN